MTERNYFLNQPFHLASLLKPVLTGSAIALVLIVVFIAGVDNPDPSWPRYWQLRPLIVVPLAGAGGGFFYYLMKPLRSKKGWQKIAAYLLCLLLYVVGLWLGTVVGLDGTLWN